MQSIYHTWPFKAQRKCCLQRAVALPRHTWLYQLGKKSNSRSCDGDYVNCIWIVNNPTPGRRGKHLENPSSTANCQRKRLIDFHSTSWSTVTVIKWCKPASHSLMTIKLNRCPKSKARGSMCIGKLQHFETANTRCPVAVPQHINEYK